MGLLTWLRGTPAPLDRTATWIHEQIVERRAAGDIGALISACAALRGRGAMIFGMVAPGKLAGRGALAEEAIAAVRALIPELPDDACAATFAAIERAKLPVDVRAFLPNALMERSRDFSLRLLSIDVVVPGNDPHILRGTPDLSTEIPQPAGGLVVFRLASRERDVTGHEDASDRAYLLGDLGCIQDQLVPHVLVEVMHGHI